VLAGGEWEAVASLRGVDLGAQLVIEVMDGGEIEFRGIPNVADFKPMRGVTLAAMEAYVAGMSSEQLRRVVAWLLWTNRGQLTEDIRTRETRV
jgi:hypothetical protein